MHSMIYDVKLNVFFLYVCTFKLFYQLASTDLKELEIDKIDVLLLSTRYTFISTFRDNKLSYQFASTVLKELEIDKIDVLLLALSKTPNVIEDSVSFEHLKPLWWELEREVNKGRIGTLGICDADKTMLEKLHQWARVS